jgi:predicted neuraminidase
VPIYDGQIRDEGDGLSAAYMIIPPGGKDNHAATIEQLPDGSLVGAWFSGDHEEASNLAIAVSRLPTGKTQWTNATLLAKKEGYASQNPLLFYDNTTGKLHLFHTRAKADSGEGGAEIYHMYSKDGGVSWSDTEKYFENTGVFTRNAIIRRKDNGLLWPFYSTNGCKTSNGKCPMFAWTKSSSIPDSGSEWTQKIMDQGKDLEQPTCWRQPHDSSTIECYFRDCGQQHIYSAQSTDEGKSFSNPEKTSLPNPGSGIEGTPLTNGDLVLIFNPTTDDKRDPLSAGISTDDGKHWKSRKVQDGPTGAASAGSNEFAYPTVLQTPDGNIHVMYTYSPSGVSQAKTIKYIRFTEDWITKSSSLTYW